MATNTTVTWNVYKVWFDQGPCSPSHAAIVLVPAEQYPQMFGRIHQVIYHPAIGMEYATREQYNYMASKSYKDSELQFQIPAAFLEMFEKIAAECPPPYDPNAPLKYDPKNNIRDCVGWVEDVLHEVRKVLRSRYQQGGHQQGGNRRGGNHQGYTQHGGNSTA